MSATPSSSDDDGGSSCDGEITQVQTKFTWVIRKFKEKVSAHSFMASPIFSTLVDDFKTNWQVNMSFDETDEDEEENISIFLDCLNNDFFRLSVQFSILDTDNRETNKCELFDDIIKSEQWGFRCFIKKNKLLNVEKSNLLHQGNLTIICTITTNQYIDVENRKSYDRLEQSLRLDESEHSLKLLYNGTFSDVVFSVEGKEIHAHKSILANRSPVFQAMFTHDMEEARNNSVVVEDISYSAMYDLLIFIYSGIVTAYSGQEQYKNYLDLLIAANKYYINNLKLECERRVSNNLKIDNVFKSLTLADTYNASLLKEKAIDFIASNADQIIETPAFKGFGKLHPELSCEVFRGLVIKRRKTDDD